MSHKTWVERLIEGRLWFICQPTLRSKILEKIITKYSLSWHFQNVVCLFLCLPEIWTISFRTVLILLKNLKSERNLYYYCKHKKGRPHFGNARNMRIFVVIVLRMLKGRLNVTNKLKDAVMFWGTPCTLTPPPCHFPVTCWQVIID